MAGKATYAVGLLALPIAFPILFIVMIGGQALSSPAAACGEEGVSVGPSSDPDLDAEQMRVAQQIVAAVRAFPATADKPHAAVIALATARQESGIRNLDYGDRDSLGAFQQRPSQGWGTPEQVMNVPHATTTFLQHLVLIQGGKPAGSPTSPPTSNGRPRSTAGSTNSGCRSRPGSPNSSGLAQRPH